MQDNNTGNGSVEHDISGLKLEMVGVKHVLSSQEKILEEIKDVLVSQSKTLENMVHLKEKTNNLEDEVQYLRGLFEARKEQTDENHRKYNDFISKFKGGLIVISICAGALQTYIGNAISGLSDDIQQLKANQIMMTEKLQAMKEKEDVYHRRPQDRPIHPYDEKK